MRPGRKKKQVPKNSSVLGVQAAASGVKSSANFAKVPRIVKEGGRR